MNDSNATAHKPVDDELRRRVLHALFDEWKAINALHFRNQLKPPAFELSESDALLGRWSASSRMLSIQREFALREPWPRVREILKHEMAHQYVHEALGILDETAHGPAFQRVCKAHGFDGSAQGMPGTGDEDSDDQRVLRKVEKLLTLAQSPNPHEAEAAMHTAQQLLARHHLDTSATRKDPTYVVRWLGVPRQRIFAHEKVLGGLLSEHFLVATIYVQAFIPATGKTGVVLEICGARANVETAHYVFDFMLRTSEQLWEEDKRKRQDRSDRDRMTYLAAVMSGFRTKLNQQKTREAEQALVHVKSAGLDGFHKARYPRRTSMGAARWHDTDAAQRGHQAGERVVLRKGVEEGATSRGRLLAR